MKNKKIILKRFCTLIICYGFCLFFPWWIITILGMIIGFNSKSLFQALVDSSSTITFSWFIMLINNLYIQSDKFLLIGRMKDFLKLNDFSLIIITLIIPFLISLITSYFGYELKKAVKNDQTY